MPQESSTVPGVMPIEDRGYARPEVLVSTDWVADHLHDPKVRLVESDEDVLLYETGHVPGAVKIDWVADLNDPLIRDYVSRERLQAVLRSKGISQDTTIVFYGDKNNWWACYSFWVLRLFGIEKLRIMDGGRMRWAQEGRPLETAVPSYAEGNITVGERNDPPIRAFRDDVVEHVRNRRPLVDVRSPEEFRGERLHMPEYPSEGALRGGHIPGAKSIPWARAVNSETHTFRPASELRTIYEQENGFTRDGDTVVYCRIGERSSHTWFALTYLLGFQKVRNYDGSWTEWGNAVRLPIEKP
ncbi:MAG TPA: sulfurtransferase [Gemmatimonadales bacterium]|jgi:thiosulfate/3-mercaptopyruvate sulfurtransferase|nr:sulfurtransferase [Gemmatimonadales bacterium]